MDYKKLRILSYDRSIDVDSEYKKRYESYTTIHTGLKIYPFLNEQRKTDFKFELFYLPLPSMLTKEERIKINSDKLRKTIKILPGIAQTNIFLSNIIDEIQSTNETEGVESTKYEIGEAITSRDKKKKKSKKKRFEGIVNMYMNLNEKSFEFIEEPKRIREIYDALFNGEEDVDELPDGELFRSGQVEIKENEKVIHRGNISESDILNDINHLIAFMNNKEIPYIPKCIVSHYFLEYVHPFYDGNGRLGRFIVSSYLSRKLDIFTGVSISNAVNSNKSLYYKAFEEAAHPRNKGEITHFIEDMMTLVISGQEKVLSQLTEALAKLNYVEDYIKVIEDLSKDETSLLYGMIQDHLFSMFGGLDDGEIAQEMGKSRYKVDQWIKQLVNKGYIHQVKKKPSMHKLNSKVIECIE